MAATIAAVPRFRLPPTALTVTLASMLMLSSSPSWAMEEFPGTRALGMGGATRAFAIGDSGPLLNPSGMSLLKNFQVLEGTYGYSRRLSAHTLHASVVDNTSGFGIAGGLYYNYRASEPAAGLTGHGHEGGLALSVPILNRATIGGTVKYFSLSGVEAPDGQTGGVTFDAGATISVLPKLSVAVVGTNLRNLHTSNAAQGVGYGVAVIPIPELVIAVDGLTRLTRDNYTGRKGTGFMAGGELTLAQKFGVRAGGGYDPATANGYLAAGLSLVSEVGAIDGAIHQDVVMNGTTPRSTVVAVSLRLFIPAQQPLQ
jgi:hypothetical protein